MTTDWDRNFGRAVRQLRERAAMTQAELAEALAARGAIPAVHQVTIGKMENAQRPTPLGQAYAIAEFFEVDLHEMAGATTVHAPSRRASVTSATSRLRKLAAEIEEQVARIDAAT